MDTFECPLRAVRELLPVGICVSVWLVGEGLWVSRPAISQIAGDRSFGTIVNGSQIAPCISAVCTIEGGLRTDSGSALLHSFETFSLPSPTQSALFVDPAVDNILVRVTGGASSVLNSVLSTSMGSEANLFFVNPAGIQFGPNAQLDIGGSFVASTAQSILFDSGVTIATDEATAPTADLLSISTPIGLGFLPSAALDAEGAASAPISVDGPGHFLTFGAPGTPSPFVNRTFQPGIGLSVPSEDSIKLFGNGITLSGGSLTATGGNIELGSVAAGRILFDAELSTDFSQVNQYADIALAGRSLLEVSASAPGKALLRGQNVAIAGSSAVLAESLASPAASSAQPNERSGGLIEIRAVETVRVSDFDLGPMAPPFHSYLSVDVAPEAADAGGEIAIAASTLQIDSGGQLGANTFGRADAGRLVLDITDSVILSGGSALGPSGLFSTADGLSSGQGGQVEIQTRRLVMTQGAQIFVNSFNQASSGDIFVSADQVSLLGTGEFVVAPSAPPLVVPTLIQSGMGPFSQRRGGSIRIDTTTLAVTDGAEISTGTFGAGDAGALSVTAKTASLSGFSPVEGPSGLFTTVGPGATGKGGLLSLEAEQLLTVSRGAQVATSTAGLGSAGDLFVRGAAVQLLGRTEQGRSGLFATAVGDRGAGGNLRIEADRLTLDDGAAVSVGNFLSGFPASETPPSSPFPPGLGAAGNLQVSAEQITVRDESLLSAETVAGDRGNIRLQTELLTLRRGSRITTNATGTATGGNIRIEAADYVVAVPEENSDITANAVFGDGGRVDISARQILGLTERDAPTPESDITASSEFGLSGETRVENVDGEVRSTAEPLPPPTEVPDVLQGCAVSGSSSGRFVQSGQGGLASSPYGVLNRRRSLSDVSIPNTLAPLISDSRPEEKTANEATESGQALVEAQSWGVDAQGQVILTATAIDDSIGRCASE